MRGSAVALLIVLSASRGFSADKEPAPGVPNFHEVDAHLSRGAQPTNAGFKSLADRGVKTIIDLREGAEHGAFEKTIVEADGMHYVNVPMRGLAAPTDEQMATIFNLLGDSSGWPVFIHCKRGADRTGTVIACYRISHDRWDNEKALQEAKLYGMSRLEVAMRRYILDFKVAASKAATALLPQPAEPNPGAK